MTQSHPSHASDSGSEDAPRSHTRRRRGSHHSLHSRPLPSPYQHMTAASILSARVSSPLLPSPPPRSTRSQWSSGLASPLSPQPYQHASPAEPLPAGDRDGLSEPLTDDEQSWRQSLSPPPPYQETAPEVESEDMYGPAVPHAQMSPFDTSPSDVRHQTSNTPYQLPPPPPRPLRPPRPPRVPRFRFSTPVGVAGSSSTVPPVRCAEHRFVAQGLVVSLCPRCLSLQRHARARAATDELDEPLARPFRDNPLPRRGPPPLPARRLVSPFQTPDEYSFIGAMAVAGAPSATSSVIASPNTAPPSAALLSVASTNAVLRIYAAPVATRPVEAPQPQPGMFNNLFRRAAALWNQTVGRVRAAMAAPIVNDGLEMEVFPVPERQHNGRGRRSWEEFLRT